MASSIPAIYHDSPELSSDSASNDYDPESVIHGRVGNLGWTESQVNKQLAGGISNVELWKLRRRFNKVLMFPELQPCHDLDTDRVSLACDSKSTMSKPPTRPYQGVST